MNRFKVCILALSLGFNFAFAGVWLWRPLSANWIAQPNQAILNQNPSSLHRRLEVTQEQWVRLSPLVDAFKMESKEERKKIGALRCKLLDLLAAPVVDKKAVESTQHQLCALILDMKKRTINLLLGEKDVLSEQQYNALIREIRQRTCSEGGHSKKEGSFTRILINDPDFNEY
ncbi:hypothetical protein [Desulfobacter sp.]|uniref:hypothetical protein n=1 Tax=Desulfobacter sp. TaxID=2294 RepID=UPI003D0D2B68